MRLFFDPKATRRTLRLVALGCLVVGPAFAQRVPDRAEQIFAEAQELYANAFYEQAIERFETFLRQWPSHDNAAEALYYQAEASLITGHGEQAVMLFTRFRRRHRSHPFLPRASFTLGQHFFATERYERAINELALALDPKFPAEDASKALYWMGESARHLGRLEDALEYFHRAADEYPKTEAAPRALYTAGLLHVDLQAFGDAAASFERLDRQYSDSSLGREIRLALAEIYFLLEDYENVIVEVLDKLPSLPHELQSNALFLAAVSHTRLGNMEKATTHYLRVVENHPGADDYRQALFEVAWAYHKKGLYESAAQRFTELAAGPKDELTQGAAYHAGANYLLAGRTAPAIRMFTRVADEWPGSKLAQHAYFEIGSAAYAAKDWQRAHDAFSRLLSDLPSAHARGEVLLMRGYASVGLGNPEAALIDFEEAAYHGTADPGLQEEIRYRQTWDSFQDGEYLQSGPAFLEVYQRDPHGPRASDALFWAAESAYQTDDHDQAEALFRRYLREFKDEEHYATAHYALGWIAFRNGQYGRSITEFEAYLRLAGNSDPFATDTRLRLGDANYGLKRFNEAIRHYSLAGASVRDYVLFQIGQSYGHTGNTSEAERAFRTLLSSHPDSEFREEAQYALGYLYFQAGDYGQAVSTYRTLIRMYPRDPLAAKAQYGIGDALFNGERYTEAVEEYARVLTSYPQSPFAPEAASSLQYAAIASGDETEGVRLIDEFIQRNPNLRITSELRFRQAEVKYQGGRLDEALDDFKRFVERRPEAEQVANAWFYIGAIHEERGRDGEAEAAFRHVMNRHAGSPRSAEAAGRVGSLLLRLDRAQDALSAFQIQESRTDEFDRPAALYGQAQALIELGRASEVEGLLQPAVDKAGNNPHIAPAVMGLGLAAEAQGHRSDAQSLYEQVVRLSNEELGAEALLHLGRILLEGGEPRRAVEELSRMNALYSFAPDYLARGALLQASAFRELGQHAEALLLYDNVIADYEGSAWADSARAAKSELNDQ